VNDKTRKEEPMETGQSKPPAVVTGASSGIGYEPARVFGERKTGRSR
jgi:NADP-dependent 3-hydroxy acid dehydrogenase YdfG